jgi:hypothetical protein
MPGEGDGQVSRILGDLLRDGYQGFVSIEPHISVVFHNAASSSDDDGAKAREQFDTYVAYGRRLGSLIDGLRAGAGAAGGH